VEEGEAHPAPAPDLSGRQPLLQETSRSWIRIHGPDKHALYFGRVGIHRFDDPNREYGVLSTAEDAHGALIETFGRQLDVRSVTPHQLSARAVSAIQPSRALRLIDLASSGGLARLGADGRLTSGSVWNSRQWSRALWRHPIGADGIRYRLRHDPDRCGCALFDRASGAVTASPLGTLYDPGNRSLLGDILDTYGFSLLAD
jgi:hypothetical protein